MKKLKKEVRKMGNNYSRIMLICETKSNLFIGGMNETFEIGGIDMYTVTENEKPYIPGSSIKGVFRNMFRDIYAKDTNEYLVIEEIFLSYLNSEIKKIEVAETEIETIEEETERKNLVKEKFSNLKKSFEKLKNEISIENIFGISGMNNHPRLIFSDFSVLENGDSEYFSVDIKNRIIIDGNDISSDPRIYKTIKKGTKFNGSISLKRFTNKEREEIYKIIVNSLEYFNNGDYRLGNSKSRGYGLVEFKVSDYDGSK
jgi:CRISPR-associated protein Csm3